MLSRSYFHALLRASYCRIPITKNLRNMHLKQVVTKLEEFGSREYAEKWDNVGLLIEPTECDVKKILLTNDLTENVMSEAVDGNFNLIISYHPPIFTGLKRLTSDSWKERIVIKCLENKIALYSPHTIWDSVPNGTSEWLANSLPQKWIQPVVPVINRTDYGAGRICQVDGNVTLRDAIEKVKAHTGMKDLRVAVANNGSLESPISFYACCPGSGTSILNEVKQPIDLFITGEMSHHDILDAVSKNIHVIILNHSNSERGYLKRFSYIFRDILQDNSIEIAVSEVDKDPLATF